jgi:hypothetical protein
MSGSELNKSEANHTFQQALPRDGSLHNGRRDESALLKQFMELTGDSESQARNTFIFVIGDNGEPNPTKLNASEFHPITSALD